MYRSHSQFFDPLFNSRDLFKSSNRTMDSHHSIFICLISNPIIAPIDLRLVETTNIFRQIKTEVNGFELYTVKISYLRKTLSTTKSVLEAGLFHKLSNLFTSFEILNKPKVRKLFMAASLFENYQFSVRSAPSTISKIPAFSQKNTHSV